MSSSQRTAWGLILGLVTALAAAAEPASLRWRAGAVPLGLQVKEWRAPCGSVSFPCAGTTVIPLYASEATPRSLSMQVASQSVAGWHIKRSPDLNFTLVGQAGIAPDLGVYGRIGATTPRSVPGWTSETGLTWGVGLSWDFSPRASAVLGWDSYDLRSAGGDSHEVRATSLGLQWRY